MKKSIDSAPETAGQTGEPTISPSRRRMLRGAAASVPVIMTLKSGAAYAYTSSDLITTDNMTQYPAQGIQGDNNIGVVCLDDAPGTPRYFPPGSTEANADHVKYELLNPNEAPGCLVDSTWKYKPVGGNQSSEILPAQACTYENDDINTGPIGASILEVDRGDGNGFVIATSETGNAGLLVSGNAWSSILDRGISLSRNKCFTIDL